MDGYDHSSVQRGRRTRTFQPRHGSVFPSGRVSHRNENPREVGSYPTEDGRRLRRGLIWRVAPFATRSAVLSPQVESRFCVGGRRMGFVLTALRNGLWHAGTVLAGVVFVA